MHCAALCGEGLGGVNTDLGCRVGFVVLWVAVLCCCSRFSVLDLVLWIDGLCVLPLDRLPFPLSSLPPV